MLRPLTLLIFSALALPAAAQDRMINDGIIFNDGFETATAPEYCIPLLREGDRVEVTFTLRESRTNGVRTVRVTRDNVARYRPSIGPVREGDFHDPARFTISVTEPARTLAPLALDQIDGRSGWVVFGTDFGAGIRTARAAEQSCTPHGSAAAFSCAFTVEGPVTNPLGARACLIIDPIIVGQLRTGRSADLPTGVGGGLNDLLAIKGWQLWVDQAPLQDRTVAERLDLRVVGHVLRP